MTSREMAGFGMTIMVGGLRMSFGVMRRRLAGGNGTEPALATRTVPGSINPIARHDEPALMSVCPTTLEVIGPMYGFPTNCPE
jgi:hypothetical protein